MKEVKFAWRKVLLLLHGICKENKGNGRHGEL